MAATESPMLPLGTVAPACALPDPDGNIHALDETTDARAFLVMFICNYCPFVKHVAPELARLGDDYAGRGVVTYAINSNDYERYPDDAPDRMRREAKQRGYAFP